MFDEYKKDFEKEKKELVALKETEINNLEKKLIEMNNTIYQPRLNCENVKKPGRMKLNTDVQSVI